MPTELEEVTSCLEWDIASPKKKAADLTDVAA
jgi:hypothetical protein